MGTGEIVHRNIERRGRPASIEGLDLDSRYPLGTMRLPYLTLNGTLTVGSSGTGHDVTFWGGTAGKKVVWDASANGLYFVGGATLNVVSGTATSLGGDLSVAGDIVCAGIGAFTGYLSTASNLNVAGNIVGGGFLSVSGGLEVGTTSLFHGNVVFQSPVIGVTASEIEALRLSGATYDDVQNYMNFFGDRTLITGGAISDGGSGTAAIAGGTAWCKVSDSDTAVGKFFDFSGDTLDTNDLADQTTSFVYVDYNGGTPQIVVATSVTTHGFKQNHIFMGAIFRDDTVIHFHQTDNLGIGRMGRVHMHHAEETAVHRASGMATSLTGTRNLIVTAGVLYGGLNRHPTSAFNTQSPDTFTYWYSTDGGTTWAKVSPASTQIDNLQYNLTTDPWGLATLSAASRRGVHWVFMDNDGTHLHVVYGQGNYTVNQAEEAGVPANLPNIVTNYCVLIAKIIVQKSQDSLIITYPWTIPFTSSLATDHSSLGNLLVDTHTQYLLADGTRALAGAWDMGSQNLTNVDIDSGTIDGVTITSPNLNEAVALTATASELNLLDLAGLTAGELLVATGAAAAAWQSTGVKLSAPDISGTVSAASALTLPAFTMGADIAAGGNEITALDRQLYNETNLLENGDFEVGDPPTGWTAIGTGVTFAQTNAKAKIGTYSALVTNQVNQIARLYQDISGYAYYKERTVTLGCWLWADAASRARILIDDGVAAGVSGYHSGASDWEWFTATRIVAAGATKVSARVIDIAVGASITVYADGAILVEGDSCPAFSPKHASVYGATMHSLTTPSSAGDPLIKGTRVTTAELPAMTDEKIWKGSGANVEEIDVPVTATKEVYTPVTGGSPVPLLLGVLIDGAAEYAVLELLVPQDFASITTLEVIFTPSATGADMHFDITTYFGAYDGSEDYNAGSETENARDIGATVISQNLPHNISDLVTGLAAGDLLRVRVDYDATAVASNAYVSGLRLKYA